MATLVLTAYNGIQAKARDAKRETDLTAIQKALELYHAENGGYPNCFGGTYQPGDEPAAGIVTNCLTPFLSPKYFPASVQDPINSGSYQYFYGVGFRKTGSPNYAGDASDNYMLGGKLEASSAPQYSGWGPTDLNYLAGSNN